MKELDFCDGCGSGPDYACQCEPSILQKLHHFMVSMTPKSELRLAISVGVLAILLAILLHL